MAEQTNSKLIKMMALSEEVQSLNLKLRQLLDDLHNDESTLGLVVDISNKLTEKVNDLNSNLDGYKGIKLHKAKQGTPSYVSENIKRQRVSPQGISNDDPIINKPIEKRVSKKIDVDVAISNKPSKPTINKERKVGRKARGGSKRRVRKPLGNNG
jgi:hypothetical protein